MNCSECEYDDWWPACGCVCVCVLGSGHWNGMKVHLYRIVCLQCDVKCVHPYSLLLVLQLPPVLLIVSVHSRLAPLPSTCNGLPHPLVPSMECHWIMLSPMGWLIAEIPGPGLPLVTPGRGMNSPTWSPTLNIPSGWPSGTLLGQDLTVE